MPETRRRMLLAGAVAALTAAGTGGCYALVQARVLPGRAFLAQRLGRCGTLPPTPDVEAGRVEVRSYGGKRVVLGFPPSASTGSAGSALSVVLMFHGAAGDARTPFDYYGLQYYWPDNARFVVAGMDDWAYDELTNDLLPFLRDEGFDTSAIGLLGWSMGGRGALEYAALLGPRRVAAVATASAAIDGSAVPDLEAGLHGIPVQLTCGREDSFAEANTELLAALGRHGSGGLAPGCHDTAFRRRMLARQLRFFAERL